MSKITKPCLFLDRDGVIIKNAPYATDPDTVELLPGAIELIKLAHQKHYWVIIVTNQSGIGRGLLSLEDYNNITTRMLSYLNSAGANIDHIYYAAFYEKSSNPEFTKRANWRKPEAGMLEQACLDYPIDLKNSVMFGDRATDILAGFKARVGRNFLLYSSDYPDEIPQVPNHIEYESINLLSEIVL